MLRTKIIGAKYWDASGKNGKENLKNPYAPSLIRTPAKITEPAVGAWTWACGNQVWNGKTGTLIANPINIKQKKR